jgi:acetyl-CoA synthetase
VLRKLVNGEQDSLGDLSTIVDPSVVEVLLAKVEACVA